MYKHTEIRLISYAAFIVGLVLSVSSMANLISEDVLRELIGARLVLWVLSVPAVAYMVFGERATKSGNQSD